MATCASCGATGLVEGARFCHECGAPTTATCVSCGEVLVPGARFCSSCGSRQDTGPPRTDAGPEPVAPDATPTAERRITSVLFGDLVGFTTMSESRDQEESRELLSRFFDGCRRIVGRYGGTIEKFIGDAVMAVWGVPTTHEDDAERAVRAGLELTRMVTDLGGDVGIEGLSMRVGIVTGQVAVTIGAEQQGMVAGDAVNTASRVQSVAAPGEVWVDETTKLLTTAAISYVDAGSHTLKGKADALALWSARAVVGSIRGVSRADGLEAPFVGHDRELRVVREVFHSIGENRRAALLVVDAEPGLGKSRLGWEFFKYVDGLTQPTYWHQGRCLAYGEGVAFWALAEAVRLRLVRLVDGDGDDEDDEDSDAAELVAHGLAALGLDDSERAWLAPRVGALLGGAAIGTFAREELFAAWVTFFERVSQGEEVVFLVDDAQHADDGLLAFVEYLLEYASFPALVVLLTRPELLTRRPGLANNRRATVLHLPTLEPRDMTALVQGLVSGLPDDVCSALVARAEGVPLYAVETVRSLIDRDLVVPRGGQYVLAGGEIDLGAIGAPASLQTLIAARLDALTPQQRRVVNQASVLGATFDLAALRELCPGIDVDDGVGELVRLQILTKETNRLSAEYGQLKFVQSVVRQVAYATLARRDRKIGHLAAARYLQGVVEPGSEKDAVIAQHFLDAKDALPGDPDIPELEAAAIELFLSAAERASSLGVPDEAAGHLATALQHAGDSAPRAELHRRMARALLDSGRSPEAIDHASQATTIFDELGDEVSAGRAVATWARAMSLSGEPGRAIELAKPRFDTLRQRADAGRAALELAQAVSWAETSLGLDALETLDIRMRLADRLGDAGELADTLAGLSMHYANSGAPWVSRLFLESAAELAREHQLPSALARALTNLTADRIGTNLGEAVDLAREAVAVGFRAGQKVMLATAQANLCFALLTSGRWSELDAALAEADALRSTYGELSAFVEARAALYRGQAPPALTGPDVRNSEVLADRAWFRLLEAVQALAAGEKPQALALAMDSAQKFHDYAGTYDDFVHALALAGDLAVELRDDVQLDRLLGLVEGEEGTSVGVRAHRAHLRGLRARDGGPIAVVEESLREAITLFDRWGSRHLRARAQADLGAWLHRQGRSEEADALVASARTTFTELGAAALLHGLAPLGVFAPQ